jgi:hypothetical protein
MSSFWRAVFRLQYRILAWLDPLIRAFWRRFGIGNVVELRVVRRTGGVVRSRLVGLLHSGTSRYIGHPNGDVGWTLDLATAGNGTIVWPSRLEWHFDAVRLDPGRERDAAIRATTQHPFPGNLIYRLARRHIRSQGVFYRLETR